MIPTDHLPKPLPRWKCHKEVTAARIKELKPEYGVQMRIRLCVDLGDDVNGYIPVTSEYLEKHRPEPGGYFLKPPVTHPIGKQQLDLLQSQLSYMRLYSEILDERLQAQ
jgi:hypothetical protein